MSDHALGATKAVSRDSVEVGGRRASDDVWLSAAVCCFLAYPAFSDCFAAIAALFGFSESAVSVATLGILCFIIIPSIPILLSRFVSDDLLVDFTVFSVLTAVILFSWLLHPSFGGDAVFLGILSMLLTQCLGMYCICRAISNWDLCWRFMFVAACAITGMQLATMLLSASSMLSGTYSQSFAYQTLPAAAYFIVAFFGRPRVSNALLLAITIGLIFASGTRGPLLSIALLLVALLIFEKRLGVQLVVVVAGVLVFIFFFRDVVESALLWVRGVFVECGLSTRLIDVLYQNDFFASSSRPILLSNVLQLIEDSPWFGYGIGADRIAVSIAMDAPEKALGYYAHNFVLEVLMQFGVVVGAIICIGVCVLLLRAVAFAQDSEKAMIYLLVASGFFPLLVSGSYVTNPQFFMLLALSLSIVIRHGRRNSVAGSGAKLIG